MDVLCKTFEMCCIERVILCPRFSVNQLRNPASKYACITPICLSIQEFRLQ